MSEVLDNRFPRDSRLINGHQYSRVFEKNFRSADRYWTILSRKSAGITEQSDPELQPELRPELRQGQHKQLARDNQCSEQIMPARLGMAVAKKCAKRAVDRNRLKRLARESFRQHKHSLAGFDIVLLARHASVTASNAELLKSLENHWTRILKNA